MSGSEEALARMTIHRLRARTAPHLLIGGYGMGFTLRAALAALPPGGRATVSELVPEILDWARGPMAQLAAGCLDDPRVTIVERDVASMIAEARAAYDAILLDVDNGPDGLVREANDRLYSPGRPGGAKDASGLAAIYRSGRPRRRRLRAPAGASRLRCRRGQGTSEKQWQGAMARHLVCAAPVNGCGLLGRQLRSVAAACAKR
jgi:hypothetical protein